MPLSEQIAQHIALAATADPLVTALAEKMTAIAASEAALRSAYATQLPGQATFANAGQTGLAQYAATLVQRLHAGETRPELVKTVGQVASSGWEGAAA